MGGVRVIIFHPAAPAAVAATVAEPLTRVLAEARDALVAHQAGLFRAAGADEVDIVRERATSFGAALRALTGERPGGGSGTGHGRGMGLVVLGAGAVPLLRRSDAARLLAVAASGERRAITNNRYSSDVCALGDARVLATVPDLPGDNALPRWLAEGASVPVEELPGRERLAMDLDSPLDLGLLALAPSLPPALRRLLGVADVAVPQLTEIRALLADRRGELLVFGRSSARGMALLERRAACRVRFLAEERGLRASSPLAQGPTGRPERGEESPARIRGATARSPRATLGRLLETRGGARALGATVAELADGALLDSRVLLADRMGPDEAAWPAPEDRYASDLLRPDVIADPWLRDLTRSAAAAPLPILLGGHSLVGPGLALLLADRRRAVE